MDFKKDFHTWERLFQLKRSSKSRERHGGLWNPSESLRQQRVNSVEIYDSIAELIRGGPSTTQITLNSLMPFLNSGVKLKPTLLKIFRLSVTPSEDRCECFRVRTVISSVDGLLTLLTLLRTRVPFEAREPLFP